MTAAQLLGVADTNDKLTEAHAYIGVIQMIAGTPTPAKVHFEWVKANGNKNFVEYDLAIAELNRKPGTTTKKPLPKKRP